MQFSIWNYEEVDCRETGTKIPDDRGWIYRQINSIFNLRENFCKNRVYHLGKPVSLLSLEFLVFTTQNLESCPKEDIQLSPVTLSGEFPRVESAILLFIRERGFDNCTAES